MAIISETSIAEVPDEDRLMDDRSSNDDAGTPMEEPTPESITRDMKMSAITINDAGKMIPAIRLYNSMRRNTSQRNKICCEGWLIHFTNKDDMVSVLIRKALLYCMHSVVDTSGS